MLQYVTVYLLRYNNYANRHIKKPAQTLNLMIENVADILQVVQQVGNFPYGDGIATTYTVNSGIENGADYLVTCNPDNNEITSRWFIIDANYLRNGQCQLTLKRDTIAEKFDKVKEAMCYIEKGYIPAGNVLQYNREPMQFNQVKQREFLLQYNKFKSPWYVAYMAYKTGETDSAQTVWQPTDTKFSTNSATISASYAMLDEYPYNQYIDTATKAVGDVRPTVYLKPAIVTAFGATVDKYIFGPELITVAEQREKTWIDYNCWYLNKRATAMANDDMWLYAQNHDMTMYYDNHMITSDVVDELLNENGKVYKVGNKFYQVVAKFDSGVGSTTVQVNKGTTAYNAYRDMLPLSATDTQVYMPIFLEIGYTPFKFTLIETTGLSTQYEFSYYPDGQTTKVCSDSPYELVAIPYNDCTMYYGATQYQNKAEIATAFMQKLGETSTCYDIQILPYINIDTDNFSGYKTVPIKVDGALSITTFAIKLPVSSFSATINLGSNIANTVKSDIHKSVTTDVYRLVSPNGIGEYEWSPAKNNGDIGKYEIDCTYKPYNPYIKVNPYYEWDYLYGEDFNDYRGLICGGDFSATRVSSQWAEYELNNKNYQNIFNRQIEGQELRNDYALLGDVAGAISGTVSGAATGAAVGGVYGAIAGGVMSAAGGVADTAINQHLRQFELDTMQKNFNWNLGNIKARPQSLTKTTSYNINNKYFPYVEEYSCTPEEDDIYKMITKWQGMTVKTIAPLKNYLNTNQDWTYVKAQLIDSSFDEDAHFTNDINMQLQGGIRIDTASD